MLPASISPNLTRAPHVARLAKVVAAVAGCAVLMTGCDDGAVKRVFGKDPVLSRWARDSIFLADAPEILWRVLPDAGGAYVVPIATLGKEGIRPLRLSARAWRKVDEEFMRAGKTLVPYRAASAERPMRMFRGMWQPGAGPLDSLNCPVVMPMARAITTGGEVRLLPPLATNKERPALSGSVRLTQAQIDNALRDVGTLVAPTAGVPAGQLSRYERRVHQIPTGINGGVTLVVEYNDRAPLPDTLLAFGERPRQLIAVMDEGTYGYRPTLKYSTVGAPRTLPKLEFLDYLDVDGDGVPELFFGLLDRKLSPLFTVAYRFENDVWREIFRFTGNRCDF